MFEALRHTIGHTPLPPGRWRAVTHGKPGDAEWRIKFACPQCGTEAGLDDHEIDADGEVSPSVHCATDCGFHDHVVLIDWDRPTVEGA